MLSTEQLTIKIGKRLLVRDLNLAVKPGECWALLGPNGSGKTTFLLSLLKLHAITSGKIFLLNKSVVTYSQKQLAQTIGILFQDYTFVFPQTVWHFCLEARFPHLGFFAKPSNQDITIVTNFLQQMDLYALRHKLIQDLSGGEKQRLYIANLLCQMPKVYLLDEPTNHLDVRYIKKTFAILQTLLHDQQAAIIMSLQDPNLAQEFCSHVMLFFPEGNVCHGTKEAVLTATNLSQLYRCNLKSIPLEDKLVWITV